MTLKKKETRQKKLCTQTILFYRDGNCSLSQVIILIDNESLEKHVFASLQERLRQDETV